MRGAHGFCDLQRQVEHDVDRQPLRWNMLSERLPLEQLHDNEKPAVVLSMSWIVQIWG